MGYDGKKWLASYEIKGLELSIILGMAGIVVDCLQKIIDPKIEKNSGHIALAYNFDKEGGLFEFYEGWEMIGCSVGPERNRSSLEINQHKFEIFIENLETQGIEFIRKNREDYGGVIISPIDSKIAIVVSGFDSPVNEDIALLILSGCGLINSEQFKEVEVYRDDPLLRNHTHSTFYSLISEVLVYKSYF